MSDNPWKEIETPAEATGFNARRIADTGSSAWGLYWGVDRHRRCLLILQHDADRRPIHRLPTLRGLRVEAHSAATGGGALLVLCLTAGEHRDLFYRLCSDIVKATGVAASGKEALERVVVRTWRWHRLLRGGRDGRLTREEQKGLIGELCVLERHLLPAIGASDAVQAWVGPLGEARDFRIGTVGVEAKARPPLAQVVRISSVVQLESTDTSRLFLHVTDVAEATEDSDSVCTLTDVVRRTRDAIIGRDISAVGDFEDRVLSVGFDWADDYSDCPWMIADESLYEVVSGFPRLTPDLIPAGVTEVRYGIVLAQCDDFRARIEDLRSAIAGGNDGD